MARKRTSEQQSAIVQGAGFLMSFAQALVAEVKKQGGNDQDLYQLVTPNGVALIERIAETIVQPYGILPRGIVPYLFVGVPVSSGAWEGEMLLQLRANMDNPGRRTLSSVRDLVDAATGAGQVLDFLALHVAAIHFRTSGFFISPLNYATYGARLCGFKPATPAQCVELHNGRGALGTNLGAHDFPAAISPISQSLGAGLRGVFAIVETDQGVQLLTLHQEPLPKMGHSAWYIYQRPHVEPPAAEE